MESICTNGFGSPPKEDTLSTISDHWLPEKPNTSSLPRSATLIILSETTSMVVSMLALSRDHLNALCFFCIVNFLHLYAVQLIFQPQVTGARRQHAWIVIILWRFCLCTEHTCNSQQSMHPIPENVNCTCRFRYPLL